MASIAEILMAQGRQASESRRARAGAWMPLVQHLANLPGQVMADRAGERAAQEAAFDRGQQRDVRAQQLAKGEQEMVAAEATAEQKRQMNDVLQSDGVIGPDQTINADRAQQIARAKGYTEIFDDILSLAQEHNAAIGKVQRDQVTFDNQQTDRRQVENQRGVRRMIGESVAGRGGQPLTPQEAQTYQGMALQEGIDLPKGVLPEEKALTFGPLQNLMVNGKRTPVRTRSDGVVVDIKGNIVQNAQPDVEPRVGPAAQYVFAVDPTTGESRRMTEEEAVRIQATQPQGAGGLGGDAVQLRNQRTAAALNSVEKLKTLAPVRTPGPAGIAQGAGEVMKGYLGYSTKTRQFQALIQPTAMQMAAAIQGAANLSDNERKAMAEMLGSINTMDYESQMALLDTAVDLLKNNAEVTKAGDTWVPVSRAIRVAPGANVPTTPAPGTTKIGRFDVVVD